MKFFKTKKVAVEAVDADTMVQLDNGKSVPLQHIIQVVENAMEEEKKEEEKLANMSDKVKVGDKDMTVEDLMNAYMETAKNSEDEDEEEKENSDSEDEEEKENAESEEDEDENENADEEDYAGEEEDEKKENSKKNHFNSLSKKIANGSTGSAKPKYEMTSDKIARGKARY